MTALLLAGASAATAGEAIVKSYDFAVDKWFEIEESDGPITLHRIRIDRKEDRLTKSVIARPYNQQYLEPVRFQLDYTNTSSAKWKTRVTVRWLDEEGSVIDGFSANETFQKNSARRIVQASVATLKYGLQQATTLEVEVRVDP